MRKLFFSTLATLAIAACSALGSARAQQAASDDIRKGHYLAVLMCSTCHVIGPDQSIEPVLRPPAPSFESLLSATSMPSDTFFSRNDAPRYQQSRRHAEP